MITTIRKWGNSQGIRIPKALIEAMNWNENEQLNIKTEENRIIIEKANMKKNITELFDGYNGEYTPEEIDWGETRGQEIW